MGEVCCSTVSEVTGVPMGTGRMHFRLGGGLGKV